MFHLSFYAGRLCDLHHVENEPLTPFFTLKSQKRHAKMEHILFFSPFSPCAVGHWQAMPYEPSYYVVSLISYASKEFWKASHEKGEPNLLNSIPDLFAGMTFACFCRCPVS